MNYIFISPGFPLNYWNFCDRLKKNGVNVLGIGDIPYEELSENLRASLTEYYKVGSLSNYDEVMRAVAFFIFKYGRIDWLESNNEYWMEQDARLRSDFNIPTGIHADIVNKFKSKSAMKQYYALAGVKTARYHLVDTFEACERFIQEVSYPVVVKPDNGVGASQTFRLKNADELRDFFDHKKEPGVLYIMEEYVDGTIQTFDGVADNLCTPIYYASYSETDSLMDVVNENKDTWYYVKKEIQPELIEAGKRTLLAFGCNNRYFHLEFFIANSDKEGRWHKGEVLGLEVNMRPAGGYTPDMETFSANVDLYQVYADMVCGKINRIEPEHRSYCVYAAKRDEYRYAHDHDAIMATYGDDIKMSGEIPSALQSDLGKQYYMACFDDFTQVTDFARYILEKAR